MKIEDMPAVEFIDTEYAVSSINPKDADGRVIPKTGEHVYTWGVIDQVPVEGESGDVITLVVAEDTLSAEVHSGCPGTAVVTVLDDNPNPDEQMMAKTPVTIKYGQPGSLNMSFGSPLPE